MKSYLSIKGAIIPLLFCFLKFNSLTAQCNVTITNTLSCSVKVNISVYETSGSCVVSGCYSATNQLISAHTTFTIPCSGCTPCDVLVQVTEVGGTSVTVSPAGFTTGAIPVSSLCGATNTIAYDGVSDFLISY